MLPKRAVVKKRDASIRSTVKLVGKTPSKQTLPGRKRKKVIDAAAEDPTR